MSPKQLLLRCYAEPLEGQWQAFCLDFDLAAQGDTFEEAKGKLEAMMVEYVYDALAGEDKDFADQLLNRKAPWHMWVKFYSIRLRNNLLHLHGRVARFFIEPMPLVPTASCHA